MERLDQQPHNVPELEKVPEMSVVEMLNSEMETRGTIRDVVKHGVEHPSERK